MLCALVVLQNAFYACSRGNGVYNGAVIGMSHVTGTVDLVDMEPFRVKAHIQIAAIKGEGVRSKVEIGVVALFLRSDKVSPSDSMFSMLL